MRPSAVNVKSEMAEKEIAITSVNERSLIWMDRLSICQTFQLCDSCTLFRVECTSDSQLPTRTTSHFIHVVRSFWTVCFAGCQAIDNECDQIAQKIVNDVDIAMQTVGWTLHIRHHTSFQLRSVYCMRYAHQIAWVHHADSPVATARSFFFIIFYFVFVSISECFVQG